MIDVKMSWLEIYFLPLDADLYVPALPAEGGQATAASRQGNVWGRCNNPRLV